MGKAVIQYMPWSTVTELPTGSESDFASQTQYLRIEGGAGFVLSINMIELLKDFPFEQSPHTGADIRYTCTLSTWDNKAFRVSLIRTNTALILINGRAYKATPKVVEGLIRLLPVADYTRVHDELDKAGFWGKNATSTQ